MVVDYWCVVGFVKGGGDCCFDCVWIDEGDVWVEGFCYGVCFVELFVRCGCSVSVSGKIVMVVNVVVYVVLCILILLFRKL